MTDAGIIVITATVRHLETEATNGARHDGLGGVH
jgi:hypothetical protein